MHRIERERLEHDCFTNRGIAQVQQDVEPLGGGNERLLGMLRRRQQPAVVADDDERNSPSGRTVKRETHRARVARIEDSQPIEARCDIEMGARRSIDVAPVAEKPMDQIGGSRCVLRVAAPILQQDDEFGAAGNEIQRLAQRDVIVVLDFDGAEQSVV